MDTIHIHLFGKFAIGYGDQTLERFQCQKALELFCYLLIYREQPHHREQLSEIFWGGHCTSEAKKYLRKTIWQLQCSLEQLSLPGDTTLLLVEPDWLRFNRRISLWLDVLEFEKVCTSLSGRRGRELDLTSFQNAQAAESLYRGDLLEGCYQDWCIFERERLKDLYFGLVDKLMGYCEANRSYETGIKYGQKLLGYDRAREGTHLRMMRMNFLSGNRTGALRQYEACREALLQEFGMEPSENLQEFYGQVLGKAQPGGKSSDSAAKGEQIQSQAMLKVSLEKIRELIECQNHLNQKLLDELQELEKALTHDEL